MAERPIFIAETVAGSFVNEAMLSIQWNGGFADSQKKKNIKALHDAAFHNTPNVSPLEISTKSSSQLGQSLSAFNLQISLPDERQTSVECAYQGSKVFQRGGPFVDLYEALPWEAKKDVRLKECGDLKHFSFFGKKWSLEPMTAFYDWLYVNALHQSEFADEVLSYNAFTDIEFNPKKSFNCQARAAAMYVAIMLRSGSINLEPDLFLEYYEQDACRNQQIQLI